MAPCNMRSAAVSIICFSFREDVRVSNNLFTRGEVGEPNRGPRPRAIAEQRGVVSIYEIPSARDKQSGQGKCLHYELEGLVLNQCVLVISLNDCATNLKVNGCTADSKRSETIISRSPLSSGEWDENFQDLSVWCEWPRSQRSHAMARAMRDSSGATEDELNTPEVGEYNEFNFTSTSNDVTMSMNAINEWGVPSPLAMHGHTDASDFGSSFDKWLYTDGVNGDKLMPATKKQKVVVEPVAETFTPSRGWGLILGHEDSVDMYKRNIDNPLLCYDVKSENISAPSSVKSDVTVVDYPYSVTPMMVDDLTSSYDVAVAAHSDDTFSRHPASPDAATSFGDVGHSNQTYEDSVSRTHAQFPQGYEGTEGGESISFLGKDSVSVQDRVFGHLGKFGDAPSSPVQERINLDGANRLSIARPKLDLSLMNMTTPMESIGINTPDVLESFAGDFNLLSYLCDDKVATPEVMIESPEPKPSFTQVRPLVPTLKKEQPTSVTSRQKIDPLSLKASHPRVHPIHPAPKKDQEIPVLSRKKINSPPLKPSRLLCSPIVPTVKTEQDIPVRFKQELAANLVVKKQGPTRTVNLVINKPQGPIPTVNLVSEVRIPVETLQTPGNRNLIRIKSSERKRVRMTATKRNSRKQLKQSEILQSEENSAASTDVDVEGGLTTINLSDLTSLTSSGASTSKPRKRVPQTPSRYEEFAFDFSDEDTNLPSTSRGVAMRIKEEPMSPNTIKKGQRRRLSSINQDPSTNKRSRQSISSGDELGEFSPGSGCFRYRELRDRNNEASRKSRLNRKAREEEMKEQSDKLEKENHSLRIKAEEMERLVKKMREALLEAVIKSKK
uniref:BZIP domain-containing protein n=1 Tax=Timema douglasi TaxID=61478 RepID=A0A7R8VP96_TIMDO|nr:unnamed protein product [Timema douglasi]